MNTAQIRIAIMVAALCFLMTGIASAESLVVYTEHYPPYNFREDGKLTGVNTRLLLEVFDRAGAPLDQEDIILAPWPRAYGQALKNPNTCVYSTTRTEEREELFSWVGPLSSTSIAVIALKDTPELRSIDDIGDARIGVVRDDVGHQLIRAAGVSESQLDIIASAESNIKKLFLGRIDYYVYEVHALRDIAARTPGLDPSALKPVYSLYEGELYLACNRDSDPSLLQRLQSSLQQSRETLRSSSNR